MLLDNCDGALRVTANRTLGALGHGMRLSNCTAGAEAPGLVANNLVSSTGTEGTLNSYRNSQQLFYHNNVSNSGSGAGFHYESFTSNMISNLRNNIFSSGTGYAIWVQNTAGFESSDYNNLYTSGPNLGRRLNTNAPTLGDWQQESGRDENSVSFDPLFSAEDDLVTRALILADAGTDLLEIVPDDIFGNPRVSPVSIGAVEINFEILPVEDLTQANDPGECHAILQVQEPEVNDDLYGVTFFWYTKR
jgi:hypothetical protein